MCCDYSAVLEQSIKSIPGGIGRQSTKMFSTRIPKDTQNKDVYRRTIEILKRAHIFEVNCFLEVHMVHNAHLKIALPNSG